MPIWFAYRHLPLLPEPPALSPFRLQNMTTNLGNPTTGRQRFNELDALRGFALMGIALANFPEFGLWTFMSSQAQEALPTAGIDQVVRFLQYMFVDGKFYTIFSVLFGIGFGIILQRHSPKLFYRRMAVLLLIGFIHLMFIWNGDILTLYAAGGLLLPLFLRCRMRTLLTIAVALILLPVALDIYQQTAGIDFAAPLYEAWWRQAARSGITEDNFATWLRDADGYAAVWEFLKQGAIERMWEFASSHRLPKVLGLFLFGYCIGRARLFARLDELRPQLGLALKWTAAIGLPASALYAWSATNGHPWGTAAHSLLYVVSVFPLGFAYMCIIGLWSKPFLGLRWAGRMALTCYITQSVIGIILFYGIGFGLGTSLGLVHIELIALAAFLLEVLLSCLWLRFFRFGPLEWLWRMLTYGHYLPLRQQSKP